MSELGCLFIIIGLFFNLIATVSLFRLPDVYTRMQAAARSVSLGTCSIMLGVLICKGLSSTGFKALFIMAFLILICPVCVQVLSKGAHKSGVKLADGSVCDRYADDQKNADKNKK